MRQVSALSIGCSPGASGKRTGLRGFAPGKGWALMNLRISYNVDEFDFDLIVPATQASYRGSSRRRDGIVKSFRNSFSVGLFHPADGQVGWVRATSDTVYHAYIYDLQVVHAHRGEGPRKTPGVRVDEPSRTGRSHGVDAVDARPPPLVQAIWIQGCRRGSPHGSDEERARTWILATGILHWQDGN